MELQHKEKKVESQVRLKDKQIRYLENQLGLKFLTNFISSNGLLEAASHLRTILQSVDTPTHQTLLAM